MTAPAPAPAETVWTVGKIIDATTKHLQQKAVGDTPRLDAEILLGHVRNCKRIQLYVDYNEPLNDEQRARMRDLVKRRTQAEPVAYLVGRREFFSLEFKVTPAVLIPRPETETLVVDLVTFAKDRPSPSILELCTGSGCIAIAAGVNLPAARITAVEISPPALAVAQENAAKHKVTERVTFAEGDLFAPVPAGTLFDAVVSNPPYVADEEIESLPPDVRLHEPLLALKGGPRGLVILERIIAAAPGFLKPGGLLLLELSPEQAPHIAARLESHGEFVDVRILKDSAGLARVARALRK